MTAYRANREVRHTIRLIGAHLRAGAAVSWQGLNFDFTGVVFDGGDFTRAQFSGGIVLFGSAEFSGGKVTFAHAEFSGAEVDFDSATFSGGKVSFRIAEFSGGKVNFNDAKFSGAEVDFDSAEFSGFSGSLVDFERAEFSGGKVSFQGATFSGGGRVDFDSAEFSGGRVNFDSAKFSGAEVDFDSATFSGGEVNFARAELWSDPPVFGWDRQPPAGVLPARQGILPSSGGAGGPVWPGLCAAPCIVMHPEAPGSRFTGRLSVSQMIVTERVTLLCARCGIW